MSEISTAGFTEVKDSVTDKHSGLKFKIDKLDLINNKTLKLNIKDSNFKIE